MSKGVPKKIFGYVLSSVAGYAVLDALSDLVMYLRASKWVAEKASENEEFMGFMQSTDDGKQKQNLSFGPFYDSSVVFSHHGMVATVNLPCKTDTKGSDITVKAIRKGGFRWTLLHNMVNGEWDVVMMDALVGMEEGGRLVSLSLLDDERIEATSVQTAIHHPHTLFHMRGSGNPSASSS